jgi:hypothetical protein
MTTSSLGKDVTSLLPGSSLGSLSKVRDPEVMKFLIIPQSLCLCLTGYLWFGQASSSSLSMWSVSGHTYHFTLRVAITMYSMSEPSAFLSSSSSWSAVAITHWGHCFHLFLLPLDDDTGWCHSAVARDRERLDCLLIGGTLGGDAK